MTAALPTYDAPYTAEHHGILFSGAKQQKPVDWQRICLTYQPGPGQERAQRKSQQRQRLIGSIRLDAVQGTAQHIAYVLPAALSAAVASPGETFCRKQRVAVTGNVKACHGPAPLRHKAGQFPVAADVLGQAVENKDRAQCR